MKKIDFRGLFLLVSILLVGAIYELYTVKRDACELAERCERLLDRVEEDYPSFMDVTMESDEYCDYWDIAEHYIIK